jgi:predicted small secreted protein
MKKTYKLLCISLAVLLLLAACELARGQGDDPSAEPSESPSPELRWYLKPPDTMNSEKAFQIREDYRAHLIALNEISAATKLESIWILMHLGTFSGCEVVYMASPVRFSSSTNIYSPAGIEVIAHLPALYVYKDAVFLNLVDAYNKAGWLTEEDILEIQQENMQWSSERQPPSPSPPSQPPPKPLNAEQEIQIREDFHRHLIDHGRMYENSRSEKIWIAKHYGSFNGCEAVSMGWPFLSNFQSDLHFIAGYKFKFLTPSPIYVYNNSDFLELADAYEAGWLTTEDVGDIWHKWERTTPEDVKPRPEMPTLCEILEKMGDDELVLVWISRTGNNPVSNKVFLDKHIGDKSRKIHYDSEFEGPLFSGSLLIEATKAEIEIYLQDESVMDVSPY